MALLIAPGTAGPQGPPFDLNYQGEWAAGTTYSSGMGVTYNGSLWHSIQTTTGNAPVSGSAFWVPLTVQGPAGSGGDSLFLFRD